MRVFLSVFLLCFLISCTAGEETAEKKDEFRSTEFVDPNQTKTDEKTQTGVSTKVGAGTSTKTSAGGATTNTQGGTGTEIAADGGADADLLWMTSKFHDGNSYDNKPFNIFTYKNDYYVKIPGNKDGYGILNFYSQNQRILRIVNDLPNLVSLDGWKRGNWVIGIRIADTLENLDRLDNDVLDFMPYRSVIEAPAQLMRSCVMPSPGTPEILLPNPTYGPLTFIAMDLEFAIHDVPVMANTYEGIMTQPEVYPKSETARRQLIAWSSCWPKKRLLPNHPLVQSVRNYGSFIDIIFRPGVEAYFIRVDFGYWFGNDVTGDALWEIVPMGEHDVGATDDKLRYFSKVKDCAGTSLVTKQLRMVFDHDELLTIGLKLSNWVPDGEYYGKNEKVTLSDGSRPSLCKAFMDMR